MDEKERDPQTIREPRAAWRGDLYPFLRAEQRHRLSPNRFAAAMLTRYYLPDLVIKRETWKNSIPHTQSQND